jgi:hypothetical protein
VIPIVEFGLTICDSCVDLARKTTIRYYDKIEFAEAPRDLQSGHQEWNEVLMLDISTTWRAWERHSTIISAGITPELGDIPKQRY